MDFSRSRGIDQAHIADDRRNIETRTHGGKTTWDNVAALKDLMSDAKRDSYELKSLIDSLPTDDDETDTSLPSSEEAHEQAIADAREQVLNAYQKPKTDRELAIERVDRLRLPDDELIELTAEWNDVKLDQDALNRATAMNGNPNVHGKGVFFESGNLPTSDESVYRHVGSSAVVDLMINGFVRNKREAAGALGMPGKQGFGTEGATVYWFNGESGKRDKADLVIQASKAAADRGYVTKDDIEGIWVTDKNTGQAVNLIDGQDHTGLEMAEHKK